MSEREDDFTTLREFIEDCKEVEPWLKLERITDALARIQARVEALEGALREIAKVASDNYAEHVSWTIEDMARAALAGEPDD